MSLLFLKRKIADGKQAIIDNPKNITGFLKSVENVPLRIWPTLSLDAAADWVCAVGSGCPQWPQLQAVPCGIWLTVPHLGQVT